MPASEYSPLSELPVEELLASTGYTVTARGLMHKDGRVMLALGVGDRLWRLPGGVVRRMETPTDAVRRSIHGATGVFVSVGSFLGVVHNPCECTMELVFGIRPVEGCQVRLDREQIVHALWFRMNALPANCCECARSAASAFMDGALSPFLVTHRGGNNGVWQSW
ncbi:MAG: NUDIX hydrolase [Armatimonadota bacterium]